MRQGEHGARNELSTLSMEHGESLAVSLQQGTGTHGEHGGRGEGVVSLGHVDGVAGGLEDGSEVVAVEDADGEGGRGRPPLCRAGLRHHHLAHRHSVNTQCANHSVNTQCANQSVNHTACQPLGQFVSHSNSQSSTQSTC